MGYSGARGTLIYEKNLMSKISCQTPLKTTQNGKKFWARSKIFFLFFSFMNPLYDPILVFSKFDPLTASGMALCVDLGPKCQILFLLVWD